MVVNAGVADADFRSRYFGERSPKAMAPEVNPPPNFAANREKPESRPPCLFAFKPPCCIRMERRQEYLPIPLDLSRQTRYCGHCQAQIGSIAEFALVSRGGMNID
jgi:hypothetical protein